MTKGTFLEHNARCSAELKGPCASRRRVANPVRSRLWVAARERSCHAKLKTYRGDLISESRRRPKPGGRWASREQSTMILAPANHRRSYAAATDFNTWIERKQTDSCYTSVFSRRYQTVGRRTLRSSKFVLSKNMQFSKRPFLHLPGWPPRCLASSSSSIRRTALFCKFAGLANWLKSILETENFTFNSVC